MGFGVIAKGVDGVAVLTETTVCPVYRGKAYLKAADQIEAATVTYVYTQVFGFDCEEDIIPFVVAADGSYYAVAECFRRTPTSWEIAVFTINPWASAGLEVYVFSTMPPHSPTGYGLAIKNSVGTPMFSSNLNHLILDYAANWITPATELLVDNYTTATIPSITKPAVFSFASSFVAWEWFNGVVNLGSVYVLFTKVQGTTAELAWGEITRTTIGYAPRGLLNPAQSSTDRLLMVSGASYD